MPSPEAGEGNDAEGFKVVSSNEFDDAIFDLDFTFAAEMARKFSQDTSPSTHSQQHPQRPVSGEVHESSRIMTVPLKSDDAPSAIIKRPRSSGEPPSQGFKFVKATGRQLDMTRKRSSKTQASEIPEPRTTKKQGHTGSPLLSDTGKNENGQEPLVRKEGGREQPNASELQEPINSFSGIQKVQLLPESEPKSQEQLHNLNSRAAPTKVTKTGVGAKQQEHDSALKAAKKARLTASTKLQQLQNANQELGARIQELEASLTSASQEVKELQHDKKTAAKAYAKTEKRIALLEAEKAVSKDADQQQASQKVAELELELSETQKDFKNAKQVIKMLEKDLSQKVGDLAEQKDRMAEFVKDKQDTLSKILEGQATKDSVDGILENVRTIHSYLNDSVQSKLDGLKESEELSRRNNGVFEQRLFDRFHEEFKTYAPSQEDLVEARKENAALEERCALLQESVTEMRKRLDEAASTKEATQRNHTEVLTELSRLRDSLTSVDSTRLQQLEASKAVVDQELRNALIRIDAEERKFRSLSETQLALRQEVVGLKEQLINAKETISKAHSNNSQDSTDISQLIEAERENARLYYSKHSRDVVQQNQAKHANELHTEQEKTRQANESLRSQSAQIASLKEQIRQKDLELQSLGESSPVGSATVDDLQRQLDAARTENTEIRISMQIQSDRELNEIQVRLNDLQVQKRESDLRCKQAEENNATVQGHLQASNNKFAELQQQLEAARNLVKEYDQEAEKQKSDAEEWLHLREEQWAAEAEGIRSQLEAANSQMQENEASTQLRFEEYEEQLRNYRRLRENTNSFGEDFWVSQELGKQERLTEQEHDSHEEQSLFPPQLDQDDVATSSPTSRLRDRDSTARQTNPSIENPFFEEERPLRQGSHQPDSAVVDESLPRTPFNSRGTARAQSSQRDSPLFMDPPNARNQVTYSHHRASKRRASGQDETYSSKRVKGGPTNYRSSPIMTRAVSRGAVSHSQVPESQSQDLHKPLQPQSQQQSARAPSVSRMRTSEASSSNAVRNSPPKGGRRRKTEEIGGRFDQEIKSSR
ncbi:Myosin ii heavy chain [Lasiodiplodia theobromae]|uniref:Myosin ii heavy chain n=1 Tax=Lasiodiplodia theobromae TaxID=45133 RepID=UPI0015C373BA|nr:Myosin ii heavy chain [Lasiodiplodia theobromae]KAF4541927.1 Myosin ii heavy chain [Lasiodiplodia theobromae]